MITIYPPDCTDFSTNGNGALSPISCEVTETLNGEYEVTLVHPIDEAGKWQRLVEGCILRVPVPIGMTPYVNLPDTEIKVDKTTRGVWRITSTCRVRSGPDNGYKIVGTYQKPDVAVSVIGSVYTASLTNTQTGTVLKKYYSSYPTDPVPTGYTRTIAMWYKVHVDNGQTGYTQGGISNTYHSQDLKTIVGETVHPKQYRDQPFRIYRIVPELDRITVYARHIFYDLLDYMVKSYTAGANDRYRGSVYAKPALEYEAVKLGRAYSNFGNFASSFADYREGDIAIGYSADGEKTQAINIWFASEKPSSISVFKTWLTENPVTVLYELYESDGSVWDAVRHDGTYGYYNDETNTFVPAYGMSETDL